MKYFISVFTFLFLVSGCISFGDIIGNSNKTKSAKTKTASYSESAVKINDEEFSQGLSVSGDYEKDIPYSDQIKNSKVTAEPKTILKK